VVWDTSAQELFDDRSLPDVVWDEEPIHELPICDHALLLERSGDVNLRELLQKLQGGEVAHEYDVLANIDGQLGRAKWAARGPACFGPAQARPGTILLQVGPARPVVAGRTWAGSMAWRAARGPACLRGRPV
jgi:hypothetical protein